MSDKHATTHHSDDTAFQEALAPIVNNLIKKHFKDSQEEIASQLAPVIGIAIREQIRSNKEDIVDALYPVIGNMISKYVTQSLEELLEKINTQIQNGLSFATLKRKIVAKIKGVSETELLLSEITNSNVEAVLLIHKESGVVLAHLANQKIHEPEMLGSMMTAIRSFVNDWVEQNGSHHELGEIDYGGNKIILEASGYSYLAVIVKGATYKNTYDAIRQTLQNIIAKYGEDIKKFQGDVTQLDKDGLEKLLLPLLQLQEDTPLQEQKKKSLHPVTLLLPLALLGGGGYLYYKHYTQEQLHQKIVHTLENTPRLALYKLDASITDNTITLTGKLPDQKLKTLAMQQAQDIAPHASIQNSIIVIPKKSTPDPHQINAQIAYLLKGVMINNTQTNISYTYNNGYVTLKGTLPSSQEKQKLVQLLKQIDGVTSVQEDLKIIKPKQDISIKQQTLYFPKRVTHLTPKLKNQLKRFYQHIQDHALKYRTIKITIYSDGLGSQKLNTIFTHKRATSIKNFLQKTLHVKNKLVIVEKSTPPQGIDPKTQPNEARCATISLMDEKQ